VLATENPIEHEGTYSLPEAELDRFLLKLLVTYPAPEEEIGIVGRSPALSSVFTPPEPLSPVLDREAIAALRAAADAIYMDGKITEYIVSIVAATRPAPARPQAPGSAGGREQSAGGLYRYVSFGASPRASIALYRCSRILAMFSGRDFVSPDDVKAAAYPALRHRIVLSYEAEADGLDADTVITRILSHVPIP